MLMTFHLPRVPAATISDGCGHTFWILVHAEPFNYKLAPAPSAARLPSWRSTTQSISTATLRHHLLARPGGERELAHWCHSCIRSHSISPPLWEFHLIEGLAVRQFALCLKIHHALADGMSLMHIGAHAGQDGTREDDHLGGGAGKQGAHCGQRIKTGKNGARCSKACSGRWQARYPQAPPLPAAHDRCNGSIAGQSAASLHVKRLPLARVGGDSSGCDYQ